MNYNKLIYSFKNLVVKRVGGMNQAKEEAKVDSLNAANIFISLSDNIQETFGLTVIEAMAAELPCIVSDWNGYKDLIKNKCSIISLISYLTLSKRNSSSPSFIFIDVVYQVGVSLIF